MSFSPRALLAWIMVERPRLQCLSRQPSTSVADSGVRRSGQHLTQEVASGLVYMWPRCAPRSRASQPDSGHTCQHLQPRPSGFFMGPPGIEPRAALTAFGFGLQSGGAGMAADLPDRLATDGYPRIPAGRNVYGCQRQRHVFAGGRFWNELGLGANQ
jgi:hypothetical protein